MGLLPYSAKCVEGVSDSYNYFALYVSVHYPEWLFIKTHRVIPDPIGTDWLLELLHYVVLPDGTVQQIDTHEYFNQTGGHQQWWTSLVEVGLP